MSDLPDLPRPPRASKPPAYCRHKASGRAYCRVNRQPVYLGPHGSPESYAEYERVIAEWRAGLRSFAGPARTVNDLIQRFRKHAERHYRDADGTPTCELESFRKALHVVRRLYGRTPVRDFGPKALKAIQRAMADGSWMDPDERTAARKDGWARGWINRSCNRIKTFIGWCESEELVPPGTTAAFRTVPPLRPGQHGVRDTAAVVPVPEADLARTVEKMPTIPRAIVDVLLLTGARPSEILNLKVGDLDRTGRVELARNYAVTLGAGLWAYQPERHKTAYKGHRRVILFGPRAQAVLAPYLVGKPAEAFVFSPAESVALSRAERRKRRKSPVPPSQRHRAKRNPKRRPGERYTTDALLLSVRKAAERAGVPHWHTYQLRHNAATRLVEQFGYDVARIILGHKSLQVIGVYALDNLKAAARVVGEVG